MDNFIKGKPVADKIAETEKDKALVLNKQGIFPRLQIIRVGEKEDDISYEKAAIKRMISCGIFVEVTVMEHDVEQDKFVNELEKINANPSIHGILILRPLPNHLDEDKIKHVISPKKDVDCFNPENLAKIIEGDESGFAPCTPAAVMEILQHYEVDLKGKNVVVIGRSLVVGKPLSLMLLKQDATVTICHSKTKNIEEVCSKADILVVAIGKAGFVSKEFIKKDAIVIDVGINVDEDGKMCGDVKTAECAEIASMITPVPGGVGVVTNSVLAKNVLKACKN